MHDGRVQYMEDWLVKKKLNEAYKITQLRGENQHQENIARDAERMKLANSKSYSQWVRQRALQSRYEDMERARAA